MTAPTSPADTLPLEVVFAATFAADRLAMRRRLPTAAALADRYGIPLDAALGVLAGVLASTFTD